MSGDPNAREEKVQVPSSDPVRDPHEEYKAYEKNKDNVPPSTEKIVEISEEDAKLKERLDVQVALIINAQTDDLARGQALDALAREIRSATSSVTSVPKPLKFLRCHYPALKAFFNSLEAIEIKKHLADVLSVLALTIAEDGTRESLNFRLKGGKEELTSWGHDYIRHLTGEVAAEYEERKEKETNVENLIPLIDTIADFYIKHSVECDACDLLTEVGRLETIVEKIHEDSHERVGLYLTRCAQYAVDLEDAQIQLNIAFRVYMRFNSYIHALRVAMRLEDNALVELVFNSCKDSSMKKQLAFLVGQQRYAYVYPDSEDSSEINPLIGNCQLNENYLALARDLDVMEPKQPEDIYKSHLAEGGFRRLPVGVQALPTAAVDSAKQNLASSFVNGFVNAGFGKDSLLTVADGSEWIFKHKDHGMISAVASLGLIMMWDLDSGYTTVDKYLQSKNTYVQAGAVLAQGLISTGVTSDMDASIALLGEYLESNSLEVKLSAIVGLGLAYAGAYREDVLELLNPIVVDTNVEFELSAFAALSLGLIFVGTANDVVLGSIIQSFMDRTETELKDSAANILSIALGLLFLGKGENCEAVLATLDVIEQPCITTCKLIVESCAYAASGSVLQVQKFLNVCGDHIVDETKNVHQAAAVIGLAAVALGEDLGADMALRSFDNLLQYGEVNIRRAIPLAYALISVSNPSRVTVVDTLSRLSHDMDEQVSQNAILAMGLIAAGTNHARIAGLLRQLAVYYAKEPNHLFLVRIAQGLLHMGKGLLCIRPLHSDNFLVHKPALAGLLILFFSSLDAKSNLLANRHWILFYLAAAMRPRMLTTVDAETLKPVPVSVRVGHAVDIAGHAGKPKSITGFQTHSTPVLLSHHDRAEFSNDEFLSLTPILEGFVMVRKNPDPAVSI